MLMIVDVLIAFVAVSGDNDVGDDDFVGP